MVCCSLTMSVAVAEDKSSSRNAEIAPRRPVVPEAIAGSGLTNPIDRLLQPYFVQHKITPAPVVSDPVFARRVYLDVVGVLPTPEELAAFQADSQPGKRERLVKKLLADRHRYAQHWLTFWNDLLRNDYRGTGYIDGGRKQITQWLYNSLHENIPFDRFVRELISPVPESEGFVKGIVWRGVVNASQVPPMQAAQNISQVFLGINLKCASCHDSFVSDWRLKDAYAFAGIFNETPLEIHHCDKPTGEYTPLQFLYPQLGKIDPKASRDDRMKQLAAVVTSPRNGRLTRTMVNRLWAKLLGRGLVEPVDEMDAAPWNRDLLDWLAVDLVDHHYDLQHTLELIMTSRAYQLPAMRLAKPPEGDFVFSGPLVRRMTAEQFVDAIAAVTDVGYTSPGVRPWALTNVPFKWIWNTRRALDDAPPANASFRKSFTLPTAPVEARVVFAADDRGELFVNGKLAGKATKKDELAILDITPLLVAGENVLSIVGVQDAVEAGTEKDKTTKKLTGPAGVLLHARVILAGDPHSGPGVHVVDINTDQSWLWQNNPPTGWQLAKFDSKDWKPSIEQEEADRGPWRPLGSKIISAMLYGDTSHESFRAALVTADPLLVALGRPNREQVVTDRPQLATTLQAVELTNGSTLADQLAAGAKKWLGRSSSSEALIQALYQRALGRPALPRELETARQLVGTTLTAAGVEDLLWIIAMLPEFQLVY